MRFPHYVGSLRSPGVGSMAFGPANLLGISVKPTERLGMRSCSPKSKSSSKPVRSVTGPSVFIRTCWQIVRSVSERRVARIMRENKVSPLLRRRRKPVTTDSNHKLKPSPNLLEQKFHCQTPNTVWLADITYIDTDEGWLYLAGIKDMATRGIVGWAMEDHMRAELCCEALKMALGRRGPVPGLIHHSDRGSQYAGGEISQTDQERGPYSIHEPKGRMPGQRADGELLCFTEKGVGAPSAVQNPRSGQGCNIRIHRGLLQPTTQAFQYWLPNTCAGF